MMVAAAVEIAMMAVAIVIPIAIMVPVMVSIMTPVVLIESAAARDAMVIIDTREMLWL